MISLWFVILQNNLLPRDLINCNSFSTRSSPSVVYSSLLNTIQWIQKSTKTVSYGCPILRQGLGVRYTQPQTPIPPACFANCTWNAKTKPGWAVTNITGVFLKGKPSHTHTCKLSATNCIKLAWVSPDDEVLFHHPIWQVELMPGEQNWQITCPSYPIPS